jgi:hypothetical protein
MVLTSHHRGAHHNYHSLTAQIPHSLNFSLEPCLTPSPVHNHLLSPSATPTMSQCVLSSLIHNYCLLSSPQSDSVSNNKPPSQTDEWLLYSKIWQWQNLFLLQMLAYQAGGVTVIPNPHLRFNICKKCWIILWLGLGISCHQLCLVYYMVVCSASSLLWGA